MLIASVPALLLIAVLPRWAGIAWAVFLGLVTIADYVLMQRRFTFRRSVDLRTTPARARQLVEEAARSVLRARGTGRQPDDVYYVEAWHSEFGWVHGVEFQITPSDGGARVTIASFPFRSQAFGFNPRGVELRWRDTESLVEWLERAA